MLLRSYSYEGGSTQRVPEAIALQPLDDIVRGAARVEVRDDDLPDRLGDLLQELQGARVVAALVLGTKPVQAALRQGLHPHLRPARIRGPR